jgi:hypothetical protein
MANIIQINGFGISSSNSGGGSSFPYTGSAIISGSLIVTGSTTSTLGFTGSLFGTASWATNALTASYLNTLNQNLTLSGSLTILNNLTVFGTQSVVYITSSQLDISTNIITVNTSTPSVRFGGIAVRDSGSLATGRTGSLLWDSQNDVWIYSNPSGAAYDGGMLLTGPRNSSGLGNEVGITTNYLSKGDGSHHMTSSQISDNGTTVTIPGNLSVNNGITGSLFGTASWATNASTSSFVNTLNQNVNITGTLSASGFFVNPGTNTIPPIELNAGTNLTSPIAGAIEYDGITLYRTNDTTSGRGYEPSTQMFRLTANGSAIGPTVANFFGANSAIQLAAGGIYEIEAYCYFTKQTAGTVTVTASSSLAPVNLNGIIQYGAAAGNGAAQQITLQGQTVAAAAFAASVSLNNLSGHAFTIRLMIETNVNASNLRFMFTESAGTVTPLRSSYYKVTKLPSGNVGNFTA